MTIGSEGFVLNPATSNNPISGNPIPPLMGRASDLVVSELRGKYGTMAMNRSLFTFNVMAIAIPVITSGVVSLFSLWNPPSSGVLAEMVDTEIGQTVVATIVDAIGWYMSSGNLALAGTFSTKAVANTNYFSARTGDTPNGQIVPYLAYTHSGTPVRVDIIGSFGAVTDIAMTVPMKVYDGRLWVPPGSVISVCASTTVTTAVGLNLSARWAEWPFV